MRYLQKYESMNKEYRLQNLPHVGGPIVKGNNFSIMQQDWFEKLLPNSITIHSNPDTKKLNKDLTITDTDSHKEYVFDKNDCTIDNGLIQFNYYYNSANQHDEKNKDKNPIPLEPNYVLENGEPSIVEFDIYFSKIGQGDISDEDDKIKLLVDITYGNNMAVEFTIEAPNKINIVHYTSIGSKYDSKSHWGFSDESIGDLVKFFNAFNHGIELTSDDLNFLDEHYDSYKHQNENPKHLYNDDSDLIKFGNSYEESLTEKEDIFLIINNAKSPLFKYFPKVARYLRVRDIPYKAACSPEEVLRYNQEYNIIGALSTGSDYSMRTPDSKTEFAASEEALRTLKCPILAMCYGFQSMAKFYGQNVDGGELNSGLFNLTDFDSEHFLFKNIDLTEQKVNFCFHDYPVNVPVDFENIAMLGETIAGISNKNLKRYGILFHPEELQETWIILDNFVNECKISTSTKLLKLQTFENFIKKSL
jgi:GMP synthase-like glutamine amidotransferase